jgi:hypothetical protein
LPALLPSLGQTGVQQLPPYSTALLGQPQVFPQPSDIPPRLPSLGQLGVQQPAIDIMLPVGQGHFPLQPSSRPARLPSAGQVAVHTQLPLTHRPLVPQLLPPQSQVSTQTPLLHTLPEAQVTPAHRFLTHWPPLQTWPLAHWTLAQADVATQTMLHASPEPQVALQALSLVHLPVPRSQN